MKFLFQLLTSHFDFECYDVMITSSRIQVETPGEYGSLEEYFRHYRSPQQVAVPPRTLSEPGLLGPDDLPNLTVSCMRWRERERERERVSE